MPAKPSEERVSQPILQVKGLRVGFDHPQGLVQAVDNVSFALAPGERFGLAGESGSGKSTLALAILRMIKPPGRSRPARYGSRAGGWRTSTRTASEHCGSPASRWCRKAR